jgi:diguanylate cyclase
MFGNFLGDQLLVQVAQRLQEWSHEQQEALDVARIDGSLFGLILHQCHDRQHLENIIESLLKNVQQVYTLADQCITLQFKVGAYLCEYECSIHGDTWIDHARIALQWCDRTKEKPYHIYNEIIGQQTLEWCRLKLDLTSAIEESALEIYYQPIANLITGRLAGIEALLRWHHPHLGCILPSKFIPIAEESNLVLDLDYWTLRKAIQQVQNWQSSHIMPLRLSINLSPKHLQQNQLPEQLKQIFEETGFNPHSLIVEITETDLLESFGNAASMLHQIKAQGVQIALDDFGKGYSSLSYLRFLPLDILKVDRTLIYDLEKDDQVQSILKAILRLAQSLNIKIIAEGVETQDQLNFLHSQGYQMIQGYVYSHPLSSLELERFLHQGHSLKVAA